MSNLLGNLLGKYSDKVSEVYEDFIYEFETKGLQWAWMMRPEFSMVPEDKRVFPFVFSLPLLTYTRINLSKSKEELDKTIAELKLKYETLPELQGRDLPEMPSIRDLLDQYFLIYQDDEIEFKISYLNYTLVHCSGLIKDIKFDMHDLTKAKVRIMPGELMTVTIKLINKGEQRYDDEERAFINEGDNFADAKLNELLQAKLYALPLDMQEKRKELLKVTDLSSATIKNLPSTEVVVLEEMINAIGNELISNEHVLSQVDCLRMVNLDKMKDWLTRPYAGGTETDYR